MHYLSKHLTTVTTLSKTLAAVIFIILPLVFFFAGMGYQSFLDKPGTPSIILPITVVPTSIVTLTPTTIISMPTITPTGPTKITIDSSYSGKTITLHKGDIVTFRLDDNLNWSGVTLTPENQNILYNAYPGVLYIKQIQGVFRAINTGTIHVKSTGTPICNSKQACSLLVALFEMNITVIN